MDWLDICLPFVKKWEGCKLHAYPDPATGGEPWTVGYGATASTVVATPYQIGLIR